MTSARRADRQRRNDQAGRPARVAGLTASIARIVETGGYPERNTMTTIPTIGALPTYAHPDDAGADLRSAMHATIPSRGFRTVTTRVRVAIPEGHFGLVAGRSGLGIKHGIALVNGIGVIDAGYRGEIQVGLVNHSDVPFRVEPGDRVAQLIIVPFVRATFAAVDKLEDTVRNLAGIGSTGVAA